jgi:hypothetical protein
MKAARPLQRSAFAACDAVFSSDDPRGAVLLAAVSPAGVAVGRAGGLLRFGRMVAVARSWERALREHPEPIRRILAGLALEKNCPVERLAAALALPVPACRAHYRGPAAESRRAFEAAFAAVVGEHGGWAGARRARARARASRRGVRRRAGGGAAQVWPRGWGRGGAQSWAARRGPRSRARARARAARAAARRRARAGGGARAARAPRERRGDRSQRRAHEPCGALCSLLVTA